MDHRLRTKSDLYVFGGYVLLGLAVLLNPVTIPLFQNWGYLPSIPAHHLHANDIRYLLPALLDVLCIVNGAIVVFGQRKLRYYLNDSFLFNLFMFVDLLLIMFSLNVIHPGKFNLLRIGYLLVLLFFLTNAFYQSVVKQRNGREWHSIYRNAAVGLYGVVAVLILLEGIFMFHTSTHRFNGTLGSRAWFLKHWELNGEGYRDAPYDSASVKGKRKVLVLGDSFVAGHGIKDPKDRFSDLLAAKLPPDVYRVFNLGVGGSDTRDENKRLREFPYKPDVLVLSWYPNDIELDGELGGLRLQHARSYHDVWGPLRYFARRSFLWNYLYWRFPHPDELSDYFGYIQQCFTSLKVRTTHLREIDRLVAYGDSLQIPMVAVVFPFLENAAGSAFATEEIEGRFEQKGIPVVSVRQMLMGEPAIDYIVNQNDPHPNERLHARVADSLYAVLNRRGAISSEPLGEIQPISKPKVDSVHQGNSEPASASPPPKKPNPSSSKKTSASKPSVSAPKVTDSKPHSSDIPSGTPKSSDADAVPPQPMEGAVPDALPGGKPPVKHSPSKKPGPKRSGFVPNKPNPKTGTLDR